jgi:hypothetical protein
VLFRWCRAIDRRDWPGVRDVFHPECYDDHGIYKGGVDGLIAWLTERHESIPHSTHLLGNILIEFPATDGALAESYCLAIQRYGPGGEATKAAITGGAASGDDPFDMVVNGRYLGRFERREGRWRILHRTTVFDSSMILPVPTNGPTNRFGLADRPPRHGRSALGHPPRPWPCLKVRSRRHNERRGIKSCTA